MRLPFSRLLMLAGLLAAVQAFAADLPLLRDRTEGKRPLLMLIGSPHFANYGHDVNNNTVPDVMTEQRQAEINAAQGEAAAITTVADATADAIRKIAEAIRHPGGMEAVNLKVAEKAVEAYAQLAKTNNTMIVPGNMTEVSALIGSAMTILKQRTPQ